MAERDTDHVESGSERGAEHRSDDSERVTATAAALACVALVLAAAVAPAVVSARPANQVPVEAVATDADLGTPDAQAWGRVSAVEVPLASAPSGLPNADDVSTERLYVQAATADGRLYLRLRWADETADRNASAPRAFLDAVAVQLPANATARPAIAMGSRQNPVNVWYWSADGTVEELYAGGAGTTTPFERTRVRATAAHRDGRWTVVLSRELPAASPNRTALTVDRDVNVAFAVWNGGNGERAGRKAVSEWYHFPFGPGPEGPPYETLLWAVAGLAVAGTALVTIAAVRRTRGETDAR